MVTKPQQMDLKTFLDLVAKLPKDGDDLTNWGDLLNKNVAGWQAVVQDSDNWKNLAEKIKPTKDRTELVVTMLNLVGNELFKNFSHSSDDQTRHGAREWFFRMLIPRSTNIPDAIRTWFKDKQELLAPGHELPKFPTVEISHDDPPAFRDNPELRKRYEEDIKPVGGRNDIIKDIDVESLLGVYIWSKKHIVIWRKGVELCSRSIQLQHQDLFNCVLVHELGHWFNAEATVANGVHWDLTPITLTAANDEKPAHPDINTPNAPLPTTITGDARSLSSRCYHEAWAQLFAWLYGHEKDAGVLAAFEALEKGQSKPPYCAWRQLVSNAPDPGDGPYELEDLRWSQSRILKSLEWSRSLKKDGGPTPATFADSNFLETNMIGWLNTHCQAAAEHKNSTLELLQIAMTLTGAENTLVRLAAVENKNSNPELLKIAMSLKDDDNKEVRLAALNHQNANQFVLLLGMKDTVAEIRKTAKEVFKSRFSTANYAGDNKLDT